MSVLFVSFWTPAYADEAAALVASLDALHLPHDVRAIPSRGTWEENCGRKPAFLREMRAEHPGRSLVWLDADSRVRAVPALFDVLDMTDTFDLAVHYRHGVELLSGTLFFNDTEAANELLRLWEQECRFFPQVWDQQTLAVAVGRTPGLKTYLLPPQYCSVFDDPKMGPPVILQTQASRRLRKVAQ